MAAGGLLGEAETAWAAYLFESWRAGTWDELPQEDREYGQRHLGAHLDDAAAEDEALYALVDERWMRAWYALESANDGFLGDVDRAWKRADQGALESACGTAGEATPHLALQLRCAVCHGSVVGMSARVSPELLAAALRTGVWSESQGLAIVKKAPPSSWKDKLWEILVRALAPSLHAALLSEVGGLDGAAARVEALLAALPALSGELAQRAAGDAVSAALQLEEPGTRGRALRQVVELVPMRVATRVLTLLEADERSLRVRDFDREDILECLARTVPVELLPRVSRLVEALRTESRSGPLLALLPRVAKGERRGLLAAAVEAIRETPNLGIRCKLLASLAGSGAPGLGMALDEALKAIERSESQFRLEAIEALGPRHWTGRRAARLMRAATAKGEEFWSTRAVVALFEGLDAKGREEALTAIRGASTGDRCEGLARLAVRTSGPLQDGLWDEALAAIDELLREAALRRASQPEGGSDDHSSAHRLDHLIEGAPPERVREVAQRVRLLEGPALRVSGLAALAARADAGERDRLAAEAVQGLADIEDGSKRAELASEVLRHLPEAVAQGAVGIGLAAITDEGDSAYFHRLLPHLTAADVEAALEAAGRLQTPYAIGNALVALAGRFAQVVPAATDRARTLSDADDRARALAGLAELLPADAAVALSREAVAASQEIGDAPALTGLRGAMSAAISAWSAEVEEESYIDVPTLPLEQAARDVKALDAIADPNAWLSALTELLPQLPEALWADPARNAWFYVQEAMYSEMDRSTAVRTMAWLLQFLPDSMQEDGWRDVFGLVEGIHEPRERSWAALDVVRLTPEDRRAALLEPMLGIAPFLAHEDDVADIFARAAPWLPASLLAAAADAAFAIESDTLRARAVACLADRAAALVPAVPTAAHACWQHILHGYAAVPRPALVDILPSLAVLAAQLEPPAVDVIGALAAEMETVSRWWP